MKHLRRSLLVPGLALLTLACAQTSMAPDSTTVDTVYHSGSIWTGVPSAERAQALAIHEGVLAFVGSNEEALELAGDATERVDLDGAFVVPGFIDNHTHFLFGGFALASVQLRDASTPEDFTGRIAAFAADLEPGRWILGGNWDHEAWGGELPDRSWIDGATTETPVFVTRLDGHMGLANSRALELAGITNQTPSPEGGKIVRDESGRPTGVLKDTAMELLADAIPEPSDADYDRALKAAQRHAVARGVTQIHDMADMADDAWRSLETFQRAHAAGDLALRLYSFMPLTDWQRLAEYVATHGRGDERLRWGGLKGFVDGSLGSTTAWFYEPYDDAPETSGFAVTDLDELKAAIAGAAGAAGSAGSDTAALHLAVHAIGDRSNDWLLDVFSEVGGAETASHRFRVEHAQHLSREAVARFAELGVIAAMQPYHAIDDGRWAEKRIGAERIRTTYAFADLLDAGATLSFGSDWTVAPIDPLQGIYAAVTRRTLDGANPDGWVPEQKITVEQALVAYTSANAYAGFQEEALGTLEAGKAADFVVLSQDLFAIEPVDIPEVDVVHTVIGGERVFDSDDR